jgi:starch synthase
MGPPARPPAPPPPPCCPLQKQLERGITWPQTGSTFWEQPARQMPMPVDIGDSPVSTTPKDPRPLHVVHFTAEMAPIAKVGARRAGIPR